jgi:hypothetical protein
MGAPGTTPGPWYADGVPSNGQICLYHPDDGAIGFILYGSSVDAESRANAYQIAASPALYDALSDACAILDNYCGHDGETLIYDHESIGEEIARLHEKFTEALRLAARGEGA